MPDQPPVGEILQALCQLLRSELQLIEDATSALTNILEGELAAVSQLANALCSAVSGVAGGAASEEEAP